MIQRLEGKHIVLRKARLEDAKQHYENYWQDYSIAETMWWKPEDSLESAVSRMQRTIRYQSENDGFLVALKETDEPIGMAGIFPRGNGVYEESGIGIAQKHQGKGYGKEIVLLLMKLAFEEKGAVKFIYCSCSTNDRSIALAKHFGFHFVGSHKEKRYDEKEFEINEYELSKEEYYTLVGKKHD